MPLGPRFKRLIKRNLREPVIGCALAYAGRLELRILSERLSPAAPVEEKSMRSIPGLLRFCGLAIFLMFTTAMFGQSTGTVQGQVTDQSGAAVPGATVTVTNTATGVSVTTKTDSTGNYQVPSLSTGTYEVWIQANGLERQIAKGLVLQVGRNSMQDFQLKVAQANEVITVEGEVPVIETSTQTVGQVIDQTTVQEIPLNGRHFLDL